MIRDENAIGSHIGVDNTGRVRIFPLNKRLMAPHKYCYESQSWPQMAASIAVQTLSFMTKRNQYSRQKVEEEIAETPPQAEAETSKKRERERERERKGRDLMCGPYRF